MSDQAAITVSLHEASVGTFLRYLGRLRHLLSVAEAHEQARGLAAGMLLEARIAPDMLPLERQAVIAANFTLRAAWPMAGRALPAAFEGPPTWAGLHEHIDHSERQLRLLDRSEFEGPQAARRIVESRAGEALVRLPAPEFLFSYALPNFFFHLSMAHAILRASGVPLGKADFDGWHGYPALR